MTVNPFSPDDYTSRHIVSARDVLVQGIDIALFRMHQTFTDITDDEYNWEPLSPAERAADLSLPAESKRVWRVYQTDAGYTYDYGGSHLHPSPFTTIAWLLNHVAQTAHMYLYCITSGKPPGDDYNWTHVPVHATRAAVLDYIAHTFNAVKAYLLSIDERDVVDELNNQSPAPWGEMRPVILNLWGGVIEHALEHTAQINARKEYIRSTYST